MTSKVETEYNNCIFALTLAQKGADESAVNAEMYKSLDSLIVAVGAAAENNILEAMRVRTDSYISGSPYQEVRRYIEMVRSVDALTAPEVKP